MLAYLHARRSRLRIRARWSSCRIPSRWISSEAAHRPLRHELQGRSDRRRRPTTTTCRSPASKPDTTYYYAVDGRRGTARRRPRRPSRRRPAGRASFRFTAFGDQGLNPPSPFTTDGVAEPGRRQRRAAVPSDGRRSRLRGRQRNPPPVWRTWGTMVSAASKSFPWMPVMGNHELERGVTNISGEPQTDRHLRQLLQRPLRPRQLLLTLPAARQRRRPTGTGTTCRATSTASRSAPSCSSASPATTSTGRPRTTARPSPPSTPASWPPTRPTWPSCPTGDGPRTCRRSGSSRRCKAAREEGSGVEMIVVQMHFPVRRASTPATAATWASAPPGARCSTSTRSTSPSRATTTTTAAACRSRGFDPPSGQRPTALSPTRSAPTRRARRSTRVARPRAQTEPIEFERRAGVGHVARDGPPRRRRWRRRLDHRRDHRRATGLVAGAPVRRPGSNNVQAVEDAPWLALLRHRRRLRLRGLRRRSGRRSGPDVDHLPVVLDAGRSNGTTVLRRRRRWRSSSSRACPGR